MKKKSIFISVFIALFLVEIGNAQRQKIEKNDYDERFSFYSRIGFLKTQMDGDNLQGFDKNGYEIGIGTFYRLSKNHYLKAGLHISKLGSRKKNPFASVPSIDIEVAMDMQTLGVDFGLMFLPVEKNFYLSYNLVYNNITRFDYNLYTFALSEPEIASFGDRLNKQYLSGEFSIGFNIKKGMAVYFAGVVGFSSILEERYRDLKLLRPYHLAVGLSYHLKP